MDGSTSNPSESDGDDQEEEEWGRKFQYVLMDVEALKCRNCPKPFGATIFQHSFWETFCSACHDKLPEKDRAAAKRCEIMEDLVSSSFVPCKHGCTGTVRYDKKEYEESMCPLGPCSCPISGCGFVARNKALLDHLTTLHKLPKTPIEQFVPFRVRVQPGSPLKCSIPYRALPAACSTWSL